jgi:acetyl-CoA carboxylase alpha subunit
LIDEHWEQTQMSFMVSVPVVVLIETAGAYPRRSAGGMARKSRLSPPGLD